MSTSSPVTTKKGHPAEKVDVHVLHHTAEATLTLWDALAASAALWKPSHTILLLSNPSFNRSEHRNTLSITAETLVDVDPEMRDAEWLRDYAQKLARREHVNPEFPEGGENKSVDMRAREKECRKEGEMFADDEVYSLRLGGRRPVGAE